MASARPFLKWAGGKQQLLAQYEAFFPSAAQRYFEPFVGGGAVFFHLWSSGRLPKDVFLFDSNEELVNAFVAVRDQLEELLERLALHQRNHCKSYFYEIRGMDRRHIDLGSVEKAARTIYLNKSCYNGLYRVNKSGQFNAPMGSYRNPKIRDEDTLRAASMALQGACIEARDFRTMVDLAQAGDFFYFDPPYHPLSKTSNFRSYTAGSFWDEDQMDLASVFLQLSAKGCLCMLSNSCTPFVADLYRDFAMHTVRAKRAISSNPNGRGSIQEVVVLSYDPQKLAEEAVPKRGTPATTGKPAALYQLAATG